MSPDIKHTSTGENGNIGIQRDLLLLGHSSWSIHEARSQGISHSIRVPYITKDERDVSLKGLVSATRKHAHKLRVNESQIRDVSTYAKTPEIILELLADDQLEQTYKRMGISDAPDKLITTWIQGGKIGDIFLTQLLNNAHVVGAFITYADHFPSRVHYEQSVRNDFFRLSEMSKRARTMSGTARLAGTTDPTSILSFPTPYSFRGSDEGAPYDSFTMSHIHPDTAEELNVYHHEVIDPQTHESRCALMPIYSYPIGEKGEGTFMEQVGLAQDVQKYCSEGRNIRPDVYPFSKMRQQFFDIAKAYAMLLFYGKGSMPIDLQINSGDLMGQIIPNNEGVGIRNIHMITFRGEMVRIGGKPEFIHALRNAVTAAPISVNGKRLVCSTFSILTDEDLQLAYDSVWGILPENEKRSLITQLQISAQKSELDYWDASQTHERVLAGRVVVPSIFQNV